MAYNSDIHHRRSLRLKGYDYAQAGAYFVTICTQNRGCLFGDVVQGEMRLNDAGRMVGQCWCAIPEHFPHIELDAFVVMPNHLHGIVVLTAPVGAPLVGAPLVGAINNNDAPFNEGVSTQRATTRVAPMRGAVLGDVVGAFKSRATVEYIRGVKNKGWPSFQGSVWQRNYYEHIIRDEADLARIREYIVNNPQQWELDRENPVNA